MKKPTQGQSKKKRRFLKKPIYPGGQKAIDDFIRQNLRYPEQALRNRIEGDVRIAYDVNEDGKVVRAEVLQGIGYGCDEEALRVVKLLQYEGVRNRGVKVTTHHTIVVRFRLPRMTMVYQYRDRGEKPASSSQYVITIPQQGSTG